MEAEPSSTATTTRITDLNEDSLAHCATYLSLQDLSNLATTCKSLKRVAYSDPIWQHCFREHWPRELLQTSGLREAYLKRRVAVQQFKFVDPLVANLYITDAKPFDHIILDKNDITFSQGHSHFTLTSLSQIFYLVLLFLQMNCLHHLLRSSSALPLQGFDFHHRRPSSPSLFSFNMAGTMDYHDLQLRVAVKAAPGSPSSAEMSGTDVVEEEEEEKSEIYSHNMTEAMGAVLTYRHELGMNYNFIRPDLIVGSCLQTPEDVDKLRKIGVKTVFCLQQDPDLEYFGVDISAIQDYAKACGDIQHLRAQIRDFDAFDLRIQLPAVVSKLHKAINQNGGVTYIHCTAGMGRAPAVALAYMFWVQGYKLNEAHDLLMSKRSSFPKLNAIKSATADILTGLRKKLVTLKWEDNNYSTVEISGLDIGWGQRIPLELDEERKFWILKRELMEGVYEYKYIVDGEWTVNKNELVTTVNRDGHINNYVQVLDDDADSANAVLRKRLTCEDDPVLTREERLKIRMCLETLPGDDE